MLIGTPVPEEWYEGDDEEDEEHALFGNDHELMQPCQEAFEQREQIRQYLLENALTF
jgi:hypothetical protein